MSAENIADDSPRSNVLNNPDILSIIFDNWDVDADIENTRSDSRMNLLACAAVCHCFSGPALDRLWSILPSMFPLLKLLPSFALVGSTYVLNNFSSAEWARFDLYARRVKTLCTLPTLPVSHYAYSWIQTFHSRPVLPALRAIRIIDKVGSLDLSCIVNLLPEDLQTLELNDGTAARAEFFIPWMTALNISSPKLKTLILRSTAVLPLNYLTRFENLSKLELLLNNTYLFPQFLKDLGRLSHLRQLYMNVGAALPTPSITQSTTGSTNNQPDDHIPFHSLNALHIIGCPSSTIRVLEQMTLTRLTTFEFTELGEVTNAASRITFLKYCIDRVSHSQALTTVTINQLAQAPDVISITIFSSLFQLNTLKHLTVTNQYISISNDDFRLLASQCGRLTTLTLPTLSAYSTATFKVLVDVASMLQCLQVLQIPFSANAINDLQALSDVKIAPNNDGAHPLRVLRLAGEFTTTEPAKMVQLAKLLYRLFPRLSEPEILGSQAQFTRYVVEIYTALREVGEGLV